MAIDRIGKGGPPAAPPAPEAGRVDAPAKVDRGAPAFEIERRPPSTAAAPVAPAPPSGSAALERLRRGEVDLDGYLDLKVDEATRHLHGLRTHELAAMKRMLRDELASDPALSDLVKQATGAAPPAPRDDE